MLLRTTCRSSGGKWYLRKFWLILISLAVVSIQISAQNGWTNPTNLSTPRFGASASIVDGKIYIMGGEAANSVILANNEMYDPLTNSWETKAPLPTPRTFLFTTVVNDTIYAIGGLYPDYSTYQLKVEAYDPVTNTWTTKNNMPSGRIGQNAVVVDGIIYIVGGNYNGRGCWAYDPSTDTWAGKQNIPLPGQGNSSSTVYNGKIYVIGGSTYSPWYGLKTVFEYDPQTDLWTQKQSMPNASFGLQTYLFNGKIYAIGGSQLGNSAIRYVQVYDPDSDTWKVYSNMPTSLVWFAGTAAYDKLYVLGGLPSGWATVEGKVWVYDPTLDPLVPVELTSFRAMASGNEITLNWSTATELNNQGFEVQRKFQDNDFVTVGAVKGHGTTTSPNQYSFVDKLDLGGKYAYRLKQMDFNGAFEFSKVIEFEVIKVDKFSLEQNYPNPFNPTTTIGYVLQEKSNAKLTLLNALGEEIAVLINEEQDKGYHKVEFNGSKLASEVYYYRLQSGSFFETKKMVLIR
jgi:N-acetylneuraminic acid mutarotase